MEDNIPTEILAQNGRESGKQQLEKRGKEYFSELGKRSAAKRKKDKRFGKRYYAALAQRAAATKRNKKTGKTLPPFEMPKSPMHKINSFLSKGKL